MIILVLYIFFVFICSSQSLVKSKSYSVVQQTDVDRSILQNRLKLLNEPEKTESGTSIDQTSSDEDNEKVNIINRI